MSHLYALLPYTGLAVLFGLSYYAIRFRFGWDTTHPRRAQVAQVLGTGGFFALVALLFWCAGRAA